jgi:RNA polymerase sigma-70 factor (ECF subfamily)
MTVAHWHELAEELMRTRRRGLVAYAFLLTHDVTAAEDLVQDAVVRTFTGLRGFPSVGHAEAYARRAIASAFLDSRRSRARETRRLERVAGREAEPSAARSVEIRLDLVDALGTLPLRQRACVTLCYLAELSTTETASALDLSEGSVKRYLADGIAALNLLLGTAAEPDERASVERRGGSR